jgi:tellurite resistance protein
VSEKPWKVTDAALYERIASTLRAPPPYAGVGADDSILKLSASAYGSQTFADDLTQPTGFDPEAAALFEAMVESAVLVAESDGHFDPTERSAFEQVVLSACEGAVAARQVTALLADLSDQLGEDGVDKRVQMVARSIKKPEHAREVLRVSALLAHVSGGVSDPEREVLQKLGRAFSLQAADVDQALVEAERALGRKDNGGT